MNMICNVIFYVQVNLQHTLYMQLPYLSNIRELKVIASGKSTGIYIYIYAHTHTSCHSKKCKTKI